MRTYCESLAWAILCSSRRLSYAYELEKKSGDFDGQKGINHLNKEENIKELNLDETGVEIIKDAVSFNNNYSHVSPLSLAVIRAGGKRYLGGFYNPDMKKPYEHELEARLWACKAANESLNDIILPKLKEWPSE